MVRSDRSITINNIAMPLIAVSALTAFCYFAAPILVPLVTAMTFAFILWPAIRLLQRLKIPHLLAVAIVMVLTLLLLTIISMVIYGEVKDFANHLPGYWDKFASLRKQWLADYPLISEDILQRQGEALFSQIDLSSLASLPRFLFKSIGSAFSFLGQAALIFLLTLFILIEQMGFTKRLRRVFGMEKVGATEELINQVSEQVAGYLAVRAITTAGLAIIFTVGLLIGGVKYAYIWGPLAALLNLIPYVGAFIGALPPMIMAAVQHGSFLPMLWVFIFFMAVQLIESNLVTPKMVGDQLNISLLVQLLATIFWGWLWGAIGIVLAVPITAAIKAVCDNVEGLKPIGIILSGDKR